MWYHAIAHYGGRQRQWWNRRHDDVVSDVLVPFTGKQVRLVRRAGTPSLFNFGAASYITILKTRESLQRTAKGGAPSELKDKSFVSRHNVTEQFANEIRVLLASPVAQSLIERSLRPSAKQLFTIMRLGDPELDSAYERVITPLGKKFGYEVIRIDKIPDSGNISQQILESIACSRVVLAELSAERPNCYYEAGFAHALGKEMIFAVNHKYEVHFDLAGYRFIRWRSEADFHRQLGERLRSIEARDSD